MKNMNDFPTVDAATLVSVMRKHGIDVSVSGVIQALMESEDTYSVNDGNIIRVYEQDTDEWLMELV